MKKTLIVSNLVAILALTLAACAPQQHTGSIEFSDSNQGIVGGNLTDDSSPVAKHVIAIVGVKGQGSYTCTGTLISANLVLTAAHCVDADRMVVVFTKSIETTMATKNKEQIRSVVAKIVHPAWVGNVNTSNKGDIALIQFSGSVPTGYQPAKLTAALSLLKPDTTVYQIGFGVSNPELKTGSGTLRHTETKILQATAPLVAVEQRKGHGVCFGDSGGPSFIKVNGEFYVWGVASAVSANPQCREYGFYTNIAGYTEWLKDAASTLAANRPL